MSRKLTQIALLLAMAVASATSCGDLPPTAGTVTFIPGTVDLIVPSTSTSTQTILVNVKNPDGDPMQGAKVRLSMYLHSHLPFAGASSAVAFLDEDGNAMTIDSPAATGEEGTSYEVTSDENGNVEFSIQFPFGSDYSILINAIAVRSTASFTMTISTGV